MESYRTASPEKRFGHSFSITSLQTAALYKHSLMGNDAFYFSCLQKPKAKPKGKAGKGANKNIKVEKKSDAESEKVESEEEEDEISDVSDSD